MTDPMKGVFQGMDIIASGLRAEMQRADIVAANIANMNDTGNAERLPYVRRSVLFEEVMDEVKSVHGIGGTKVSAGVRVSEVVEDHTSEFPKFYDPGHADAGKDGFVLRSNVNVMQEMVDMRVIGRSFQANLEAMRAYRAMLQNAISNMGRS
jgi:flagellar basal-body rod protein FlgC